MKYYETWNLISTTKYLNYNKTKNIIITIFYWFNGKIIEDVCVRRNKINLNF